MVLDHPDWWSSSGRIPVRTTGIRGEQHILFRGWGSATVPSKTDREASTPTRLSDQSCLPPFDFLTFTSPWMSDAICEKSTTQMEKRNGPWERIALKGQRNNSMLEAWRIGKKALLNFSKIWKEEKKPLYLSLLSCPCFASSRIETEK